MKTIIVAMDYSREANNAMNYAAEAAAERGAEIILFYLYRISIHALNGLIPVDSLDEVYLNEKKRLEETSIELATNYGIKVSSYITTGELNEALKECFTLYKAELIVMGMREKSLEQDLMGNSTTDAIHQFKFPVLAVPLSVRYKGIKRILFASDMIRGVQAKVLEKVKETAKEFNSEVEVFHVSRVLEQLQTDGSFLKNKTEVSNGLSGIQYFYKNIESDKIVQAITEEIERYSPDLLIMIPYKYGFWGALVHRSKTKSMASGNNVPLLSLPI